MTEVLPYEFYHQHPVNKAIHFVCIPVIVLTSLNFLDRIPLPYFISKYGITVKRILMTYYYCHYLSTKPFSGFLIMFAYINILNFISNRWKDMDKRIIRNSLFLFVLAWMFQFGGHYIEGRKPALLDGIKSAFLEAPYFSIRYLTDLFIES